MSVIDFELLIISFSELNMWDVKRYLANDIKSKYSIVRLGDYITQRNDKVNLSGFPEETFGILGVNNKTGIFDAYTEKGENINQSYKKVINGDLVYNPYRVNVGSIGIKTALHKNSYISPAYIVFECQKGLNPEFLYILFKTATFNQIIKDNTTGSVRQNLKYDILENFKIPLPSIKEQQSLIDDFNRKISYAIAQENKVEEINKHIEDYILTELGLSKLESRLSEVRIQNISFKNISRWDILATDTRIINALENSKYKLKRLGEVYSFPSRPWDKNSYQNNNFNYIELGAIDPFEGIISVRNLKVKDAPSRATQQVSTGDLIIGTTRPYLKRFAIVGEEYDNTICSSGFCIIESSKGYCLKYLKYFLSSYYGIEQLKNKMTGAIYPAITNQELKEILIPLPSEISTQVRIADYISELHEKIKNLKQQAQFNRQTAITDFEKEIFNHEHH